MINKRIFLIFLLIIIAIGMLSTVGAADSAGVVTNESYADDISILEETMPDVGYDDVNIMQNANDTPLTAAKGSNEGTFTELQNQINKAPENSTIYLARDYCYDDNFTGRNGITITKPITIDGKGHAIDGSSDSPLLLINKANNVILKNIIFKNGLNKNAGIVSAVNSGNMEFYNCRFTDNEANGAVVYLDCDSNVKFVKCGFNDNYAYNNGGCVFCTNSNQLSFISCDFEGNEVGATGGAIYLSGSDDSYFESCRFVDNTAEDAGAVYLNENRGLKFVGCVFSDNFADYTGSAIYSTANNNSCFDSCRFSYNIALDTGTIYSSHDLNSSFSSCEFYHNCALGYGGAVYLDGSEYYFDSCSFTANSADTGGAIYSARSSLNVVGTDFEENSAESGCGDIYSRYGVAYLTDSSFYNSIAEASFGGSLGFNNDYAKIIGCTFQSCISPENGGGAIHSSNSILECNDSTFNSNGAKYGGAICSLDTELSIGNCTFHNSSAMQYGGAVYMIYGSLSLNDSDFMFSSGYYGGCLYVRSPHKISSISNNRFLYSAAYSAPRIYIDEYYGEVPQSGNLYEDIYFVIANFTGYADPIYNYSNVLAYVFSSSDVPLNDLSFYDDLRRDFISEWNYVTPSDLDENITVNIYDEDHPESSIIFSTYEDQNYLNISFGGVHSPGGFYGASRLDLYMSDLSNNNLSYLVVYAVERNEISYFMSNTTQLNGWESQPVFDDDVQVYYLSKRYFDDEIYSCHIYLDEDEFSYDRICGRMYFDLEYTGLLSNFGNAYDFKEGYSPVPQLNYTYQSEYLPSSYDSRDYGYITPVVNQMRGSNCWAFAGIATLEACLKKVTGKAYDFSENNAKNLMATSSVYGLNLDVNGGGYDTMFMSYLASWLGPVDESYDHYDDSSMLSIVYPIMFHIQDIKFLSARENSLDNDEFKDAIMKYGAVAVILDWTVDNVSTGLHSVSLIGWDDDFDSYDSFGNYAKGAWIFKNSWGREWGDSGFGYLSYNQRISGEIAPYMHAYTFAFNDDEYGYQNIYQYDFAGVTDYMLSQNDFIYYKNRFVAKNIEFLYAFSTYFEKPSYFTFSVRINGQDITTDEKGRAIENSLHYSPAGYHTIPLGYNLTMNRGDEFEIIIKLVNDCNYVPVCQADELYKMSYPSNVSFISYNGEDWFDLYDLHSDTLFAYGGYKANTSQVACIKAFTSNWKRGWEAAYFNPDGSMGSDYWDYDLFVDSFDHVSPNEEITIHMGISLWYPYSDGYENFIEVHINDRTYYASLYTGQVLQGAIYCVEYSDLNVSFDEEGYYEFSARLKSNCYGSQEIRFGFVVSHDLDYATFTELAEIVAEAEEGSAIVLDKDYFCDGEFDGVIYIDKSLTIDGRGHCLNGLPKASIIIAPNCSVNLKNINFRNSNCNSNVSAIFSRGNLTISDCHFTNNKVSNIGGALYSEGECRIYDSSFTQNTADFGGAIFVRNSTCYISNTIFEGNLGCECGGAICLVNSTCYITDSVFDENRVRHSGGAIYSAGLSQLNVERSNFTDNIASWFGGSVFSTNSLSVADSNFESLEDNEVIYYSGYYDGFDACGVLNLSSNRMLVMNAAVWYDDYDVRYSSKLHLVFTDGSVVRGKYYDFCCIMDDDGNVYRMGDVNVTLTNGGNVRNLKLEYDSTLGGYVFDTSSLDYGVYSMTGSLSGEYAGSYTVNDGTLKIVRKSVISASALTKTYGTGSKLTVTLRDGDGNAIAGAYVNVKINGKTTKLKTNSKGQAILSVNMVPKKYVVSLNFKGNDKYSSASKKVNVLVKKAKPRIVASKRVFKQGAKAKKYTIVLKNNMGDVMRNAFVKITVNGKTYSAKTNSKGQATFNLYKLTRKGYFFATIKYGGNKFYTSATKKITVGVR